MNTPPDHPIKTARWESVHIGPRWLEADSVIHQQSGNKKSLEDFAKRFFIGNDTGNTTNTYTFDDMVAALNAVQPYDWHSFFHSRLDSYGQGRLIHSIDRTGYKLVFTDKPIGNDPHSKSLDLPTRSECASPRLGVSPKSIRRPCV